MKKNILIAGSSGAIGSEFLRHFSADLNVEKIITLSRKINDSNHKKIQSLEFDYTKEETFENLNHILQF